MIRSFIVIYLLSIIFPDFITAQNSQELAKEIILKSVGKYKNYNTAYVTFKYTMENRAENLKDEKKGNVFLKNGSFNLTVGEQNIISDKVKVWTYLRDANEVQISNYNPEELEINPSELFTMWEKGYLYRYVGEESYNNITCKLIELTPENKNLSYFKVKLLIDPKNGDLHKIQTYYKNSGLILTFEILSVQNNPQVTDKTFKFDVKKYPGIVVVDLTE